MVRGTLLTLAGTLVLGAAFVPAEVGEPSRAHPFGPLSPIDTQPAIPVRVFEYGFQPSHLEIIAGQFVVWRNVGEELHIVSPSTEAGVPVFEQAKREGTTHHRFTHPGRYPYHCSIHPQMRGVIVVRAH